MNIFSVSPLRPWPFALVLILMAADAARGAEKAVAEKAGVEDLLTQARTAYTSGKRDEAVALATEAISAEPKNPRGYLVRARIHEASRQPDKAVADYDAVLKLDRALAEAWQRRGEQHFKLGQIKESIADFDQFLQLVPQQSAHHWQRGISLYYAGRFAEGRKQFELHQTVNPNDVENAVWHFLCVARETDMGKARVALIPIKGDARVPMTEVHALFAGNAQPEDILKAAGAGEPTTSQRNRQLFYAHLYLGLYFEASGQDAKALEHIKKAANDYQDGDYMSDVARVHAQLRAQKTTPPANETNSTPPPKN